MSTEQENFDDLLKSKLSEAEFAFNEANWDKAETLIIAADKKRKRRRIAFIFFIGLFLGIGMMIPFVDFGNKIDVKNRSVAGNKYLSNENKTEVGNDNMIKDVSGEIKTVPKNNIKEEEIKVENNVKSESGVAVIKKADIKPENKNAEIAIIKKKTSPENNGNDYVVSETKKNKSSEIAKTKTKQGRSEAEENSNKQLALSEKGKTVSNEVKKDDLKPDSENKNQNSNLEGNTVIAQKTDTESVLASTKNNVVNDTTFTLKDSVVKVKFDSVISITKDSNLASKPGFFVRVKRLIYGSQGFIFGFDAGASYALGWKNNTTKEANGFNALFGVNVTHFFTKKWSACLGLQYNSLAHLSYSNYASNNMQFGFGYNQTKTSITPTILYYVAVPVKLQYWFNDKNSLSIGVNALYLLNTNSKVETETHGDFGSPTTNVTTKIGYRDGLATWDVQPALAYKYCFMKGFSINAEIYYGLIDIKNNNTFAINKAEHNNGFKLTMSYIFIGRNRSVCGIKDYIK